MVAIKFSTSNHEEALELGFKMHKALIGDHAYFDHEIELNVFNDVLLVTLGNEYTTDEKFTFDVDLTSDKKSNCISCSFFLS